jgi:hypothetical protein
MNLREPDPRDPVDLMIGRALKNWTSHYHPPASTRLELLEEAARVHEASVLRRVLRIMLRGMIHNLRGLSYALADGPVFEAELHSGRRVDYERTYSYFNLMHISILNANTPRLGLFSLFM